MNFASASVAADLAKSDAAYSDVVSTTINVTQTGARLWCLWSASGLLQTFGACAFRIQVDGVTVAVGRMGQTWTAATTAYTAYVEAQVENVSRGPHVVTVQWVNPTGPPPTPPGITISAASSPLSQHGHLFVLERAGRGPGTLLGSDGKVVMASLALPATAPVGAYANLFSASPSIVLPTAQSVLCLASLSAQKLTNDGSVFFRLMRTTGGVDSFYDGAQSSNKAGYGILSGAVWCEPLPAGTHSLGLSWKADTADVSIDPTFATAAFGKPMHARLIVVPLGA